MRHSNERVGAEETTRRLGGRWHGSYGTAKCPCHDDGKESLSITDGDTATLFKCFAGCSSADIAKKLGGKPNGESRELVHPEFGRPRHVHRYFNPDKTLRFVACRFEWPDREKEIRYAVSDGAGWRWKIAPGHRPPYRLLDAIAETECGILIVEGEKKADIAAGLFLDWVAVGWCGGASAWAKTDWSLLPAGRRVVVWPDNDPPGIKAAAAIAGVVPGARVVDVAALGLPVHFDLGDPIPAGLDYLRAVEEAQVPPGTTTRVEDGPPDDGYVPPGDIGGVLKPSRARFWPSLKTDARPEYLIKGVLDRGSLAEIFGPTGVGKSFLATDQGLHLAAGLARWHGCRLRQCGVLYVCAEGSIAHRMDAWSRHHDIDLTDIPFAAVTEAVNLLEPEGAEQIIVDAGSVPDLGVIYIDTAAAATPGSDEGPEAMSRLVASCNRIRTATSAAVCLVHHTGKDVGRGSRGSTVLPFATDFLLEVVATGPVRVATVAKARDGETGREFTFRLLPVDLYTDHDGDPVRSCIVDPADASLATAHKPRRVKIGKNERIGLLLIQASMPVGLTSEEWTEKLIRENITDPSRRSELRLSLVAKKLIHENGTRWCLSPV